MQVAVTLFAAALPGLFKPVEQATGIYASESLHPVGLSVLDGIPRDGATGMKELGFPIHFGVPHILVEFSDIHEHAHF